MTGVRETICERTDLPPSMCSHCRGLPWDLPVIAGALDDVTFELYEVDREDRPPRASGFRAEFASECPSCGESIRPGDRLVNDPRSRRFVCVDCGENDQRLS